MSGAAVFCSVLLCQKTVACDHSLSLYLCNLFSGGGRDTFLSDHMQKIQNQDFLLIG